MRSGECGMQNGNQSLLTSAATENFARATAAEIPCSLTTLWREVCTRTSSTQRREQSNVSARSRKSASLAAASTGNAVTFTRNSLFNSPQISLADARGCNFTASRRPSD